MKQKCTRREITFDQLVRDCEMLGNSSTYRWRATLDSWDGTIHSEVFYDDRHGGREASKNAACEWLERMGQVLQKPPRRSRGRRNLKPRQTILGVEGLGFRHRWRLTNPKLYIHGYDRRGAIMDRSPRKHGVFPALEAVCMAKAEAIVRDEMPDGFSVEDCYEKGEFEEEIEYNAELMLRVAWPRLRGIALRLGGLFDWPSTDYLNPGDYD